MQSLRRAADPRGVKKDIAPHTCRALPSGIRNRASGVRNSAAGSIATNLTCPNGGGFSSRPSLGGVDGVDVNTIMSDST